MKRVVSRAACVTNIRNQINYVSYVPFLFCDYAHVLMTTAFPQPASEWTAFTVTYQTQAPATPHPPALFPLEKQHSL